MIFIVENFRKTVEIIKEHKKNSWRTVLIYGSSNNGKSTLINEILGEHVARIGLDGTPTTQHLQLYEDKNSKILYVDSPGLEKHDNADKIIQLTSFRPDLIWLVISNTTAIEPVELDISRKYYPNTPLDIILNKVDILQEIDLSENELNNFYREVPSALATCRELVSKREKLLKDHNLRQLVLMSMREEEENDKVIGVEHLLNSTKDYFANLKSK